MGNNIEAYVDEAKKGNREAFGKLFELTNQKAYYTALKITKNPRDAEDMVQEAYIKAFTSLDSLNDDSKFEKWLNRIVANKCRDLAKKRKPDLFSAYENDESESSFEDSLESFDITVLPDEVTDNKAIRNIVMECIDKLPFEQRICVVMFYYNELSISEIAESLAVPEGTVKSRLNKARKTLRKEFENIEKTDSIKLYSASLPVLLAMAFRFGGENCKIPTLSMIKIAKKIPYILSDNAFSTTLKTLGLSGPVKRIIAGVGAAAIITGGSMAARDVIKDNKAQATTTTAIVSQITTKSQNQNSIAGKKKSGSIVKKVAEKPVISSALALSDYKNNTYFINEDGVFLVDKNGGKTIISSHKPLNLCFGDCLMYIWEGDLYQYKGGKLTEYMEVGGDYLYSVKYRLISISKDKNRAYIIDLENKTCNQFKEGSSDFKYLGKKLYYRNSQNEIKSASFGKDDVDIKNVVAFNGEENKNLPYSVKNSKIYYTDFNSDITGIINVKKVESGEVKTVQLGVGIQDFSVSQDRIYYSSPLGGLYYYSKDGKKHKLSDGNFYCSATSKGNMIWSSTDGGESYLIKENASQLIPIENGSGIIEFSIVNNTLYYRGDNGYGSVEL